MAQVAEREAYPFVKYFKLLRMPIRAFRILNKNVPAPMQDRTFLRTANIGFVGNGLTPTNHLGIQWFLEHCWEDLQRQLPGVRLRLIGRRGACGACAVRARCLYGACAVPARCLRGACAVPAANLHMHVHLHLHMHGAAPPCARQAAGRAHGQRRASRLHQE